MPNIEYEEIDFAGQKIKVPKENIIVKLLEDISSTIKTPTQGSLTLRRFNGDKDASKKSKEYRLYDSLLDLSLFWANAEQEGIPDTFMDGLDYNDKTKIIHRILSLETEDENGNEVIVGAVFFYICPLQKTAVIEDIEIKDDYQGNGYGSILFQAAMLISLLYGSKSITIEAKNDSYLFYVKYGFGLEKDIMRNLCSLLNKLYLNLKTEPEPNSLNKHIIKCSNKLDEDESDSESENGLKTIIDMAAFIKNLEKASQDSSKLRTQFEVDNTEKILIFQQKIIAENPQLKWEFNSTLDLIPLKNQIARFNPDFPFEQYVDLQVFNEKKRKKSSYDLIFEDEPVAKKIVVDSEEEDLAWINDVFDGSQFETFSKEASLDGKNELYKPNVEQTFFSSKIRLFHCPSPDLNIPFEFEKKQ